MSGVNWIRWKVPAIAPVSVLSDSVFARPGHAFEQDVATGEEGDQQAIDEAGLTDDDLRHLVAHGLDPERVLVHLALDRLESWRRRAAGLARALVREERRGWRGRRGGRLSIDAWHGLSLQGDCDLETACAPMLSGTFLEHVIDVMSRSRRTLHFCNRLARWAQSRATRVWL